jgi:hypothetical protein
MSCHFIPPYLLARVATVQHDVEVARCGHATLAIDETLRSRRSVPPPQVERAVAGPPGAPPAGVDAWVVHSADHGSQLPGRPVRAAGEPTSGDPAVDEAAAGVRASLDLFADVYARDSFDGRGAPVIATVHYERRYDNAFWDGRQLVFGDGDGRVFDRFTKPVDVCAHEFTHAVTQYTTGFTYADQSGALNESVSDAFASCVKQRLLGHGPQEADWLIGEGIFTSAVQGRALRSMAQPGTAYDDETLGRDPQVGHMADYVHTREDNGGVHLNSGIPNRAFCLAATGLAERGLAATSHEGAGRIWYAALVDGGLTRDAGFEAFAAATVEAAPVVDDRAREIVAWAWGEVGVKVLVPSAGGAVGSGRSATPSPRSTPSPPADPAGVPDDDRVIVRRTGGFAGIERRGEVRLGDDPRTPEVEQLLAHIDLRAVVATEPQPDRFVYSFRLRGQQVTLAEQSLTPELEQLARLVLE